MACRFSSFIVVRQVKDHSTDETIDKLSSIFAELGIPTRLHCDRGLNFMSSKFQDFCKGINVTLTFSSAEHPIQTVQRGLYRL